MTLYLVTDSADTAPGLDSHERYLRLLELALGDPDRVPLVLHADTRRSIGDALAQLLLYLGRAQPSLPRLMRAPFRYECGRIVVALRERRPTLMVFGAEHIHHLDVNLFANIALGAGVDLWFVPQDRCRPTTRAALDQLNLTEVGLRDALAAQLTSPSNGRRLAAQDCEDALPLGGGTQAACDHHAHAGECATASFADAVITARATPAMIRARLYELSTYLPDDDKWHIYAAARDPFRFVERAVHELDITDREARAFTLGSLSENCDSLHAGARPLRVPLARQPVLRLHRAIRLEEGSPMNGRLLVPHDDRNRRNWAAAPRLDAEALMTSPARA